MLLLCNGGCRFVMITYTHKHESSTDDCNGGCRDCYLLFVGVWGCSECGISSAEACISIWSQRECFKHLWVRNCEIKNLLISMDCSILSCLVRNFPSSFISWAQTDRRIFVALCIDIRVFPEISTSISRVALSPASPSSPYGTRWNTSRGFAPPHPASSSNFFLHVMRSFSLCL